MMTTVDIMNRSLEAFRSLENALQNRREALIFHKGVYATSTDKLQAYRVFQLVEQSYNQLIVAAVKNIAANYNDDGTLNELEGEIISMNPLEEVKIEIVVGNTSQRILTYKGNTTTIYAVYPSLCSAPICWAGRLDSCLSTIPHAIAFAGVTVEEAAEQFKKWIVIVETIKSTMQLSECERVAKELTEIEMLIKRDFISKKDTHDKEPSPETCASSEKMPLNQADGILRNERDMLLLLLIWSTCTGLGWGNNSGGKQC